MPLSPCASVLTCPGGVNPVLSFPWAAGAAQGGWPLQVGAAAAPWVLAAAQPQHLRPNHTRDPHRATIKALCRHPVPQAGRQQAGRLHPEASDFRHTLAAHGANSAS